MSLWALVCWAEAKVTEDFILSKNSITIAMLAYRKAYILRAIA
jgi:hypothetical protein